jgi:hypothetical protein
MCLHYSSSQYAQLVQGASHGCKFPNPPINFRDGLDEARSWPYGNCMSKPVPSFQIPRPSLCHEFCKSLVKRTTCTAVQNWPLSYRINQQITITYYCSFCTHLQSCEIFPRAILFCMNYRYDEWECQISSSQAISWLIGTFWKGNMA